MKNIFDCPVYILNDVELCGLGEAHEGSGITRGVMAYFTISTGVNAVRIVDGRIDRTISSFDIGKLLVGDIGGEEQTLESLTGGAALSRRKGRPPKTIRDPSVWRIEAHELAIGLYDVLLTWTPTRVVFGGGMMKDIDLKLVREELASIPSALSTIPDLLYASLGDAGGLHGALVWLGQKKH
jgi:predicted NBD/HSP70 family sugar kinase